MKKIQLMLVWKWFWLCIIAHAAVAGKWRRSAVQACRKECNKYDLTAAQCF